ncbi:MAG: hypothetical protein Q8K99_04695 [Actinomycetota bacterium]|nr:hypothetical protein [Actinomycetota bacterium]
MNNYEILERYSRGDLRRLAKGKISEIVGLDANKILKDLSRVLGNYESIRRNVEFRTPPADTILETLLEADGHRIRVDDLKPAVRARIKTYRSASRNLDLQNPIKGYRLYATMLAAAWDYEGDLLPAEANLLRVLRQELGISRTNHQLIMAHADIGRLTFDASEYEAELTFLSNEGIVLVYADDEDTHFVLSDETAESLLQLWGFEMEHSQYARLLSGLAKNQLAKPLRTAHIRVSGSAGELVTRIMENEIPPSVVLNSLPGRELAALLERLSLTKTGKKEDLVLIVLRVIDHFKSNGDVERNPEPCVVQEPTCEPEILREETVADLLGQLSSDRIADLLETLDLKKSGSKTTKIERLTRSPYNVETMLQSLCLDDLRELASGLGLRKSGNKGDLIASVISFFKDEAITESPISPKDLLDFYIEIACQDRRAYPQGTMGGYLSTTRIGLDFERATRYIFKNMLSLDTKAQRAGCEEPDGILTDDDDRFFCYECKTVLSPPYSLPIQHRLQIRNYIDRIAQSRRADRLGGYLIISHSFGDNIEQKLAEIQAASDIPIAAITAQDLLGFARKWQQDHPIDTYPIGNALRNGRLSARQMERASW